MHVYVTVVYWMITMISLFSIVSVFGTDKHSRRARRTLCDFLDLLRDLIRRGGAQ